VTYIVHSAGLPVWLGMVAAPFAVGALGFALERTIVRRFYAAPIVAMLGTYALWLIIREIVRGLIGGLYLSVPEPIGGSIGIGAMHFSAWRLVIILITALVMIGSYLLLARTAFGLRIRASLENPALARASGISTNAI
jgi:branched-chain amino acid transport system permease protein